LIYYSFNRVKKRLPIPTFRFASFHAWESLLQNRFKGYRRFPSQGAQRKDW
jgi:hypothetical protein